MTNDKLLENLVTLHKGVQMSNGSWEVGGRTMHLPVACLRDCKGVTVTSLRG